MEMIKARTAEGIMLVDPQSGKEIVAYETREVPKTQFVADRIALGDIIDEGSAGEVVPSTTGEDRILPDTQHEPAVKAVDETAGERSSDSLDREPAKPAAPAKAPKGKK